MSLLIFYLFSFLPLILSSPPYRYGNSFRIDCGGHTNFTNTFNETWIADTFYSGGVTGLVSEPLRFQQKQEKTLRFFPVSSGKKNCYVIGGVNNGRYLVSIFTVYDNYDGELKSPSFDVSVEGTVVFSWRSPWPEDISRYGASSDLFVNVRDAEVDVCFYSIATDSPVIGSLEVVEVDPLSYGYGSKSVGVEEGILLVTYGRLSCGSENFGAGFSNDSDRFGRAWQSDTNFRVDNKDESFRVLSTRRDIVGSDQKPSYFPMYLYQTAVTARKGLDYELVVDAKLDYLVWFHFAEINSVVVKAGQRVFDVMINQKKVGRIDIFKEVGSFAALSWPYTVRNLNSTVLRVKLVPVVGPPLLCGLENYALVPNDISTVPEQVTAMRALKDSLKVPGRMGWNGDPCAPSSWDTWEGVTCHPNKDKSALVVSQIDLGSQGLKGYISEQINLLSNLVSLNLTSNSLEGTLPVGLGKRTLVRLDLSDNQFTGLIPNNLPSSNLQLVLLNDNKLEGQVPEELYSIGVHGGAIDLSRNKGLCGVPSLPPCPLFWGKGSLSTGVKITIGISCVAVVCILLLLLYIFCIRRGRNEYEFGIPQDLISMSAKRSRYQRQKSLMLLEMETQNVSRFPTTLNPL